MAKFIPVEPEKWAEMVKALAEVERLQHLANQSEFYRSQLQKDTCRLENIQMQDAFKHYEAENARLKAEVERLKENIDKLCKHGDLEIERLKAEVERLTKLCQATSPDGFIHIRDINAAKEGKQS